MIKSAPTSIYNMTNEQLRDELAKVEADMDAAMKAGKDILAANLDNHAMTICSLLNG